MKKTLLVLLTLLILLPGCSKQQNKKSAGTYTISLITDIGTIDDKSFNQGSWEGLVKYAKEKGISHKYYQPTEQSRDAYLTAIDLAVRGGAKIIVTPGYLFETSVFIAQDRYPNVNFILVDGKPHSEDYSEYKTGINTVGINYAEDQAGFLAGYAAVKDGNRKLGFIGGKALPAVIRFGYGFVQGAEYAAKELGAASGSITINYHYTGEFNATSEVQALAASWYNSGVDVIFACGGQLGISVMAAAEQTKKKVIGVDVDQSNESHTVITSAMKGLQVSVYNCIADYYNGKFPGGQTLVFAADNQGVGLPMNNSKFKSFKQSDYDNIFKKLASGAIPRMDNLDSNGSPKVVPVTIIRVTEVR
ncbi:MAG: BMP family ABC transporter substrate-binding protein [Treponema sp.]|jgi:basic membrane protein A|nr:BMP family ABC transporter substrate-binding protein [Treponema sp.]